MLNGTGMSNYFFGNNDLDKKKQGYNYYESLNPQVTVQKKWKSQ